jgi:phosphate transport system permease protein
MLGGLIGLIMVYGLGQFWPAELEELRLKDGRVVLGQVMSEEVIPHAAGAGESSEASRILVRVGNRDIFGADFQWINVLDIASRATPADLVVLERREWGPMYGRIVALSDTAMRLAEGPAAWGSLLRLLDEGNRLQEHISDIEQNRMRELDDQLESRRLQGPGSSGEISDTSAGPSPLPGADLRGQEVEVEHQHLTETLADLRQQLSRHSLTVVLSDGREVSVQLAHVLRAFRPNDMSWGTKAGVYLSNLWLFISGEPREANTEGGIFPAIFGTVMMVVVMTIIVMPFGVMAAVYLREYAKQGLSVRLVRIAVNNLAGVPSIVFGVFGLGCFVYAVGGTIDQLFFSTTLPNPTFGTGGILWASLTLALLTVPVVIVATEEGLSAVPRELREGSMGLGATRLQTLWHVVLPCALPGILTGLILAMARAAGEVAPLMLTGVVKLAPALPLDNSFPFLHLDRKFMHLGFHIYDVGFQSPNVEAAKPMVYMTTLTLIVVVVTLNLAAVAVRQRLRRRYAGSVI